MQTLYSLGTIKGQKRPEVFLVQKVGKFPDIMEQLAKGHLEKGDNVSALVTAEWMAVTAYPCPPSPCPKSP